MNHRRIYSFAVIVFAGFILLATGIASTSKPPMLISVDSPHGMRKTIQNIKQALVNNNFRFLREQTLKDGLGGAEDPHFRVLYFCNFAVAHKAIQFDKRIGFMLPCRLTLIEKAGKVSIYYLNPQLVKGHGNNKLNGLCDQISTAMKSVIEEATL